MTPKYRNRNSVFTFLFLFFIILFIWLSFFFPKQTFFPFFWRKQTKRFERAKRDLDQANNPTGPPDQKLFTIYLYFVWRVWEFRDKQPWWVDSPDSRRWRDNFIWIFNHIIGWMEAVMTHVQESCVLWSPQTV